MKYPFVVFGVLICLFGAANVWAKSMMPVNVNTADVKQLLSLKGIGAKKAEAIVAERKLHGPFKTTDELTRVKGMGPHFLRRLLSKNSGRIRLKSP